MSADLVVTGVVFGQRRDWYPHHTKQYHYHGLGTMHVLHLDG